MKNKKKIKIPAYAFGVEQVTDIAKELPGVIPTLTNPFLKSTATSKGEAISQTISDSIGGLASGAKLGATVGGLPGAIAGGAVGLTAGLMGSKGKEAEQTDFINYTPRTEGKGIIGWITNRKLKRRENKIKLNVYNNRAAVQGTNYLLNEALEDLIGMNEAILAANGGSVGSLSFIDHGEVLEGPDGQIRRIPDKKNAPTDSIKAVLEPGTRILSDKLKDPDSKETFAKLYNKMISNRKSIYKDAFALNAEKLNNINNLEVFNQLFYKQEQLKRSKGIKPKYKSAPAYSKGGDKLPEDGFSDPLDTWTPPEISIPTATSDDYTVDKFLADAKKNVETFSKNEVGRLDVEYHKDIANRKRARRNALSDMFDKTAALAPILSNLFTGRPETVNAVYNPYANAITNTMRRRRFNIDPAIEDTRRNRAISNYNIRQMNTSTGANLAYGLQSAIDTDRAIANLRSMESNANNQYLGEYANTMNNLGQQWVDATNLAAEANAQNRAINRNIRRAGISQLSQWAQNRELMRNQEARVNAMMELYGPFLNAGYSAETIRQFNKWLNS